jgi:hypothetical protein
MAAAARPNAVVNALPTVGSLSSHEGVLALQRAAGNQSTVAALRETLPLLGRSGAGSAGKRSCLAASPSRNWSNV